MELGEEEKRGQKSERNIPERFAITLKNLNEVENFQNRSSMSLNLRCPHSSPA